MQMRAVSSGPVSVLDAIRLRRATRHFTSRPVDERTVHALLDAAVMAPSARDLEPWSFVVVQDPKLLGQISDQANQVLMHDPHWKHVLPHEGAFDIFYGATTLIVICSQKEGFCPVGDCYLAGQNLMLAAYAMGLATCPIGFARNVLRTEAMRTALGIPENDLPVLPIVVGYAAGTMPVTERRPPKIHSWLT